MGFRIIHKRLPVAPRQENSLSGFLLLIAFVQHSIELFTLHHQQCQEGFSYHVSPGVTLWVLVLIPNASILMIFAQCALGCHSLTVREEEEFSPKHIGIQTDTWLLLHPESTTSTGRVHKWFSAAP